MYLFKLLLDYVIDDVLFPHEERYNIRIDGAFLDWHQGFEVLFGHLGGTTPYGDLYLIRFLLLDHRDKPLKETRKLRIWIIFKILNHWNLDLLNIFLLVRISFVSHVCPAL